MLIPRVHVIPHKRYIIVLSFSLGQENWKLIKSLCGNLLRLIVTDINLYNSLHPHLEQIYKDVLTATRILRLWELNVVVDVHWNSEILKSYYSVELRSRSFFLSSVLLFLEFIRHIFTVQGNFLKPTHYNTFSEIICVNEQRYIFYAFKLITKVPVRYRNIGWLCCKFKLCCFYEGEGGQAKFYDL